MAKSPERTAPVVSEQALTISGVELATCASGTRYQGRDDMALIALTEGTVTHCVFTQNRFCAAPVEVARQHLARTAPRYLVINAGNANAGTGPAGESEARRVCEAVASEAGCDADAVLPFSTGVIGELLPGAALADCAPRLMADLAPEHWPQAAAAIMTTDTAAKLRSASVEIDGHQVSVTGIAKGSGMIKPNMATMLAYVATDAAVAPGLLQQLCVDVAEQTFNCVTVDGDTSTNDALALIATGAAGNSTLEDAESDAAAALSAAITAVCRALAQDIVRDGEGATKFVSVSVSGGRSHDDCRTIAYTVAESPLVKTALFASDPNWGRILAAIGRAPVASLDLDEVSIAVGDCTIVSGGQPRSDYEESHAARVMQENDIAIAIGIGDGPASAEIWTCDFSYDYVRINAEYRS